MKKINPTNYGDALAVKLGTLLQKAHLKLATAESCTGGRIASQITAVPGASHYFECGVIPYNNPAKTRLLSVSKALIEKEGAVSADVARAMSEGILKSAGVDLGLSVTGIAGPDGGSQDKPVGLVFIALSNQNKTTVERFLFSGERNIIQDKASQAALKMLVTYLTSNSFSTQPKTISLKKRP